MLSEIGEQLDAWRLSNIQSLDLAGMYSRNRLAHKWKAPFRCWALRELVSWRLEDLLRQSYVLASKQYYLGARILLRSGYETLAVLIYVNQQMQDVISRVVEFNAFSEKTTRLIVGSRDNSTKHEALNILTILEKCERVYPGISGLYGILSESAHPNYDGMHAGYAKVNWKNHEIKFKNSFETKFAGGHDELVIGCMEVFFHEYNEVFADRIIDLEGWIAANDEKLEADLRAKLT